MRVNTDKNCNIIISNDTFYNPNQISIFIAQLNKSDKSEIFFSKITNDSVIKLEPKDGGFITVCQIILPEVDDIDDYNPLEYMKEYVKVKNFIKP